tara:strand:- start:1041 stop:1202 length:162 start_codon:yes stop_codon:yes gene_type:complete
LKCNKSHFSVIKKWELNEKHDTNTIEKTIVEEFYNEKINVRREYYKNQQKEKY